MLTSLLEILNTPYPFNDPEDFYRVSQAIANESDHLELSNQVSIVPSLIFLLLQNSEPDFDEFLKCREFTDNELELLDWVRNDNSVTPNSAAPEFAFNKLLPLSHLLLEYCSFVFRMPLPYIVEAINTIHVAQNSKELFRCTNPGCVSTELGGYFLGKAFCVEHRTQAAEIESEMREILSSLTDTMNLIAEVEEVHPLTTTETRRATSYFKRFKKSLS